MITISAEMKAWFALPSSKPAQCVIVTPVLGPVIRGTTNRSNLLIDGDTYYSKQGGTSSDIESSVGLDVADAEFSGLLDVDGITEEDLRAGIYNGASIETFLVNSEDLSMGRYPQPVNTIATVTIHRQTFTAQAFGKMHRLQRSFGGVIVPTCPYILGHQPLIAGHADCKKDLTLFTVTGTLDGVSADQLTFYDAARTEAGPAGGIVIVSITPDGLNTIITTATAIPQLERTAAMLSGIVGPVALNGIWTVENKSGTTFTIRVDSTDTALYPAYVGSGVVTPIVADAGWFGYGLMTITGAGSGDARNVGHSREVKAYTPGQWTVHDVFPYPCAGDEAYSMIAGDDKTPETCRLKFDNYNNFGGWPTVIGQDAAMRVAGAGQ